MALTLRRSCKSCASAKSRCDLRVPRCSRCIRRKISCAYANVPLAASPSPHHGHAQFGALDPFESYPCVRLRREHVQRLIHNFLHKIAFQYYPLDLNPTSNPFLVTWWPLALGDAALFHVSLQTACLDEEFFGRAGFRVSELLMMDSVTLLQRKLQDSELAVQDSTLNSVITLATIEHGKGNRHTAEIHVAGVKQLIEMRGGIQAIMQTSPLTARMVSWVSMLIMGTPQFKTQDDNGNGSGISPIHEWHIEQQLYQMDFPLYDMDVQSSTLNVFLRLHNIFQRAKHTPLSPIKVHDLTCFVLHRLLRSPAPTEPPCSVVSECIRCGIIIYMLTIQGPAYYTHASMLHDYVARLRLQLTRRVTSSLPGPLDIWLVAVGLVASYGTSCHSAFQVNVRSFSASMCVNTWQGMSPHIKSVLWLDSPHVERIFQSHWDMALGHGCQMGALPETHVAPTIYDAYSVLC